MGIDEMTALCDSVLQNPEELKYLFTSSIHVRCPTTESQLDAVLTAARYLSKCPSGDNRAKLVVITFLRLLPASFTGCWHFWSHHSCRFFPFIVDFLGFLVKSVELSPDFATEVAPCMREAVMIDGGSYDRGEPFVKALMGVNNFVTLLSRDCELLKTLVLLIDAAKACLDSDWRDLTSRVDLFGSLLDTVAQIAGNLDPLRLNVLLIYLTHFVSSTLALAAVKWGTLQGGMLESLLKISCKIIELVRSNDKDMCRVYSFISNLVSFIPPQNDSDEHDVSERLTVTNLQRIVLCMLADLAVRLRIAEVVNILLPLFSGILVAGEASDPGILRCRLLDAVSRMAIIGSRKSYFETVVLMTTAYLDELYNMETHKQKIVPSEADTEEIKTLSAGFLRIASDLTDNKMRVDYRHLLLNLCSDVGMATEIKNGCGADFLGPLFPAVAEICYDNDPTYDIEPELRRLFRDLWYYIALYGFASPIQESCIKKELSSNGLNALQAVDGPQMCKMSYAVHRIALWTPAFAVSSAQWCQDEMELNDMHNYCNQRNSGNKKPAVNQRVALSAALGGRVSVSALSGISEVTATYLLAIVCLEKIRFSSNGGILYERLGLRADTSAFSYIFKYLKTPNLEACAFQCLSAIVHHAFGAAVSWLENQITDTGIDAKVHDDALAAHLCFLIKNMYERDEHIGEISVKLLAQLWYKFPKLLWTSACLNHLSSVDTEPAPARDSETAAAICSSNRKFVREWIICALSFAPCTGQGMVQASGERVDDEVSCPATIESGEMGRQQVK